MRGRVAVRMHAVVAGFHSDEMAKTDRLLLHCFPVCCAVVWYVQGWHIAGGLWHSDLGHGCSVNSPGMPLDVAQYSNTWTRSCSIDADVNYIRLWDACVTVVVQSSVVVDCQEVGFFVV